ncbi:MAG TPA: hypothetical protein VMV14_00840, partial [Acidimicrobiales bacterium]|nr:hypothetical protein [Acidimicrobiales bacterium]
MQGGAMQGGPSSSGQTERSRRWAATMAGHGMGTIRTAHLDSDAVVGPAGAPLCDRMARHDAEEAHLAPGATRSTDTGRRARPEEPDPFRTCFERDRDRILH